MNVPLLLLHGFAGGPDSFALLRATEGRTCLAPNLTGHGDLAPQAWARSFDEEIERIAQLVRTEVGGPVHLLGYSLGARVGLGLLVRAPELVCEATFIGVNPGLRTEDERLVRREHDRRFIRMLESEGIESFVAFWEAQPIFASQGRLPPEVRERQRRLRLGHDAAGLARAMGVLGLAEMPDFRPFLPAIDRPVTLVVGAEDQKFQKLAREMHALLTHCSVVVAPECGHNVVLEAPDLVGRIVESGSEFS